MQPLPRGHPKGGEAVSITLTINVKGITFQVKVKSDNRHPAR